MTPIKDPKREDQLLGKKKQKEILGLGLMICDVKTVSRTTLGINNIQDDLIKDCILKKKIPGKNVETNFLFIVLKIISQDPFPETSYSNTFH